MNDTSNDTEKKARIDGQVIQRIQAKIDDYLKRHQHKIADVFLEDQKVEINFKVTCALNKEKTKLVIPVSINFVTERIKQKEEIYIDLDQMNLFGEDNPAGDGLRSVS